MRFWLWTTAALLTAACDDAGRGVVPAECDPLADEGCAAGLHCRVVAGGGTACLEPEDPPDAGCSAGSCDPGESCLRVEGWLGCRAVCRAEDSAGCPDACVYRVGATSPWGACAEACEVGGCAPGLTCAPVPVWRHPVCIPVGSAGRGERCATARCARGLACLRLDDDPACIPVCDPDDDTACPGACIGTVTDVEGIGYCVR